MIILILTIPILVWFMYTFFKDEVTSPLRKIPKPDGSFPVFGHLWTFLREKNHLKLLQDWSEKYGPIFRYSRGFGKWNTGLCIFVLITSKSSQSDVFRTPTHKLFLYLVC